MNRLLIAALFACACGRVTAHDFEDTLEPVLTRSTPRPDAGSDAGTDAGAPEDAGVVIPSTCAARAGEIFDSQFPPAPMPARFGMDYYRSADLEARRLARAQTSELVCPDEAWAWVTNSAIPGEELVVIVALQQGRRIALATLPAQGIVRHLELIDDPQGGWVLAWATENRGLFTAVISSRVATTLPQRLPDAVMAPMDPHPFELVFAFGQPLVIVQRQTADHLRNELVISSVPLARSTPAIEHHVDLDPALDLGWGPLPAPAAIALGSALFVRSAFRVTEFSSPTTVVNTQGISAAWHDSQIVYLPPSPTSAGGPVIVAAGQGQGTRRYEYDVSCFAEEGGRCSFWSELTGSTWGGFGVWNHAGVSAAACGRKLAVAVRSFDSIGDCRNYGYCRAGDLHLTLIESQVFPESRNLTPRDAPADAGGFIGYDDQDVSSPIVFARSEPNRSLPFADVAWIQATADGGVELKLERAAADCSP